MAERLAEPEHDFLKQEDVDPKYWDIIKKNELDEYENGLADALDAQIQPYRRPAFDPNTYPNPAEEYRDVVAEPPEPLLEAGAPEGLLEASYEPSSAENADTASPVIPELIEPDTSKGESSTELADALVRASTLTPRGAHANRLHYDDAAVNQSVADEVLNTYRLPRHRADDTPTEPIDIDMGGRHVERRETAADKEFDELVGLTLELATSILATKRGEAPKDLYDKNVQLAELYQKCESDGSHEESLKNIKAFLEQTVQEDVDPSVITGKDFAAYSDEHGEPLEPTDAEAPTEPIAVVSEEEPRDAIDVASPVTFKTGGDFADQKPTQSIDISHALKEAQQPEIDLPEPVAEAPKIPAGAFTKIMQNIQRYPDGEYAVEPTPQNEHWPRVQYEGKWYLPSELPQTEGHPLDMWLSGQMETKEATERRKGMVAMAKDVFRPLAWGAGGLWERVQKIGKKVEAEQASPNEQSAEPETDEKKGGRRIKYVMGTVGLMVLAGVGAHTVASAIENNPQQPGGAHGIEQPDPFNHPNILSSPSPSASTSEHVEAEQGDPDVQVGTIHVSSRAIEQPSPSTSEHAGDTAGSHKTSEGNATHEHTSTNDLEALSRSHNITINHNDGGDVLIDKFNAAFGTKLHYRDWLKFAGSLTDTYKMQGENGVAGYGLNYNNGSFSAADKLTMLKFAQSHGRM